MNPFFDEMTKVASDQGGEPSGHSWAPYVIAGALGLTAGAYAGYLAMGHAFGGVMGEFVDAVRGPGKVPSAFPKNPPALWSKEGAKEFLKPGNYLPWRHFN